MQLTTVSTAEQLSITLPLKKFTCGFINRSSPAKDAWSGRFILMASRALADLVRRPEDYFKVDDRVLADCSLPSKSRYVPNDVMAVISAV